MDLYLNRPVAFSVMAKPSGPVCNLNCRYCYYLEKRKYYPETKNFGMSDEVLEKFILEYINAQQIPEVMFSWQGGEPGLAGADFYNKVVSFQEKYSRGKKIANSFQTNGTLLTDDLCTILKENNFLVGISVDGPDFIHNRHRKFKSGEPSFSQVMKGIEKLHRYKIEFNTLTTVHKENSQYPLEIYKFLKSIGSTYIQFIPVVERVENLDARELLSPGTDDGIVTDWSVEPLSYATFLIKIFDEWVRNDVGRIFVQLFDVTLANWAGEQPGLCVFSENCGNALAIEHNGDVYSCDHFVYPENLLGNLMNESLLALVQKPQQYSFGRAKSENLPQYCLDCEYRFTCHGECPKHRFSLTPDGKAGLNYLCGAYKKFFSHVHPYMQFMKDELLRKRAPANVMEWARKNRSGIIESLNINTDIVGRNDPCPCGSGRKFKNCCINK